MSPDMGDASPEDSVRLKVLTESPGSLGRNPVGCVTPLGLLGHGPLCSALDVAEDPQASGLGSGQPKVQVKHN